MQAAVNGTGARARDPRVQSRFVVAVAALLVVPTSGCSSAFSTCDTTKTCPSDRKPDATTDSGLPLGSSGGAGGQQAIGGGGGGGGSAARGTGGKTFGGGGAVGHPDAGDSDASVRDSGTPDAQVTPECSTVDGGIGSDPDHCGSCSVACSAEGTTARHCTSGTCAPTCAASRGDCNKDGKDGCEVDLKSDPDHCTACNAACSAVGTTARTCLAGVCKPTCDPSHLDCNKNGVDGCEVDIQTDPDHCGACGVVCAATGTASRHCVGGVCKPACDATHADCNKSGVDGCEVSLNTPTDCGSCKHDCLGGQCAALTCQEVVVASALSNPTSVSVSDKYVYWTDGHATDGRLMRTGLAGGAATVVASGQISPRYVGNDGTYAYWASVEGTTGTVQRVNINGTPSITKIASLTFGTPFDDYLVYALDATYLYYATGSPNQAVYRIAKDGSGVPLLLAQTGSSPVYDIAVDSTNVYYTTFNPWGFAPLDGSAAPKEYVSPVSYGTRFLALDATSLFFLSTDPVTLNQCLSKIPRGVTDPAQEQITPATNPKDGAFTVDASYIYYSDGSLERVAKTGGTPTMLSENIRNSVSILVHPEQGEQAIYWVIDDIDGSTGAIRKLALPP